jgi:hypothetical protein
MSMPLYETKAQPAAPFVASGAILSLVGWPVLGAAWYFGVTHPNTVDMGGDSGPSEPLAVLGWALVLAGAVLIGIGVYRLAQHADRAAGVRFTRDAQARTVWTTAQAADVLPQELAHKE